MQFHYNNTIRGKVKGISREMLDYVDMMMIFSSHCKSMNILAQNKDSLNDK